MKLNIKSRRIDSRGLTLRLVMSEKIGIYWTTPKRNSRIS